MELIWLFESLKYLMLLSESKQELGYFSSFVLSPGKCKQLCQRQKNVRFPLLPFHLFYAFYRETWSHHQTVQQNHSDSSRFPWVELFPQWFLWKTQGHECYLIGEQAALSTPAFTQLSCVHLLHLYPGVRNQSKNHIILFPVQVLQQKRDLSGHKSIVEKQGTFCGL